jgi:hypothetical protein
MTSNAPGRRWWPYALALVLLLFVGFTVLVTVRLRNVDDRLRALVIQELSQRFHSQVELRSLHAQLTPLPGVSGQGLVIHYPDRPDAAPLIEIENFSTRFGIWELLRSKHHVSIVRLDHMVITISRRKPGEPAPAASSAPPAAKRLIPESIVFDEIVCNDTQLLIVPKKEGKPPLDFEIHNLVLTGLNSSKPFDFRGTLTNAKPKGEIATTGKFGPWQLDDPGHTPVSGDYQFTDADLGPFPGIAGILSSTGKYTGQLASIEVNGVTDTPDFSLDPVNHKVPLHTDFSATVDGTDGDTYLHPVRATLGRSLIVATGSVIRVPEKNGHLISMDVLAPQARLQDILALAVNSDKPAMVGTVKLKTKLTIPPGKVKTLDKMILDGDFGVGDASFTSQELAEKLANLSRHALGEPNDQQAGSAVSDLSGHFHVENAVATFSNLHLSIEGANLFLDGTYNLKGGELNFAGKLQLKAEISQTVSGVKSVLLKPLDPLFKKHGAGTEVPVRITGTVQSPEIGVSVFHKTLKRSFTKEPKSQ